MLDSNMRLRHCLTSETQCPATKREAEIGSGLAFDGTGWRSDSNGCPTLLTMPDLDMALLNTGRHWELKTLTTKPELIISLDCGFPDVRQCAVSYWGRKCGGSRLELLPHLLHSKVISTPGYHFWFRGHLSFRCPVMFSVSDLSLEWSKMCGLP